MLELPATAAKLAEAEFFYRKLAEITQRVFSPEPEAFGYYLSAFVSAARSVTFALQAEHKQKYDAWFSAWEAALSTEQRQLLEHFNSQRIATVHKVGIAVAHEATELSQSEFFLAVAREGAGVHIWHGPPGTPAPTFSRTIRTFSVGGTQREVSTAATEYLQIVVALVEAFKAHYANAAA